VARKVQGYKQHGEFPRQTFSFVAVTSREFAVAKRGCVRIAGLAMVLCSVKGNLLLL